MGKVDAVVEVLKKAQSIDREFYLCAERLKEIPAEKNKLKQTLDLEKSRAKELDETYKGLQLKRKDKELELGQKEAHVKKLEGQLSQVKTNKEYGALQQEISSLKADNSLLEENIIRLLDEVEAAALELKKENKRVEDCEREFAKANSTLELKEKNLKEEIEKFKKMREGILSQIDPEIKMRYDLVLEKKQGLGLAKITGNVCGVCQMALRPQLLNEVMLGDKLVSCESCLRFLYIDKSEVPA